MRASMVASSAVHLHPTCMLVGVITTRACNARCCRSDRCSSTPRSRGSRGGPPVHSIRACRSAARCRRCSNSPRPSTSIWSCWACSRRWHRPAVCPCRCHRTARTPSCRNRCRQGTERHHSSRDCDDREDCSIDMIQAGWRRQGCAEEPQQARQRRRHRKPAGGSR